MSSLPLVVDGSVNLHREQGRYQYNTLDDLFPQLSREGVDLLNALLTFDPDVRATARQASRHRYFEVSPLPKEADFMPTFPTHHDEMMAQQQQQQKQQVQPLGSKSKESFSTTTGPR